MSFFKKIIKYITNSDYRFIIKSGRGFYNKMPDEIYLKRRFKALMGTELNLDNPTTYNEKLQWLKLHDRKPEYIEMVDKYQVKKYVAEKIGNQYVIPTLGIWDNFDDIEFDKLPKKFVLKCTHDSGGLVICDDKDSFDMAAAKRKIEKCLKHNYYLVGREWPYKDVVPRVIAEQYMEDGFFAELRDYKFFCFDGEPKALFVATDRQKKGEEVKFDFFDMNYEHLDIRQGHPNALKYPKKPDRFEEMIELSRVLSKDIPHVRVDFYEVDGRIYFGELTFYHFCGSKPFEPEKWDKVFGDWITLPNV